MNVVDSSAWLEYFSGTARAKHFAGAIEDIEHLLVPSMVLYEVFKKICVERNEQDALLAIAHMRQGRIVDFDENIALSAGRLSVLHKLPMADSVILATAHAHRAELWTQDSDFRNLEGVRYIKK
jgi:predicted nucleic acid-binding protein